MVKWNVAYTLCYLQTDFNRNEAESNHESKSKTCMVDQSHNSIRIALCSGYRTFSQSSQPAFSQYRRSINKRPSGEMNKCPILYQLSKTFAYEQAFFCFSLICWTLSSIEEKHFQRRKILCKVVTIRKNQAEQALT